MMLNNDAITHKHTHTHARVSHAHIVLVMDGRQTSTTHSTPIPSHLPCPMAITLPLVASLIPDEPPLVTLSQLHLRRRRLRCRWRSRRRRRTRWLFRRFTSRLLRRLRCRWRSCRRRRTRWLFRRFTSRLLQRLVRRGTWRLRRWWTRGFYPCRRRRRRRRLLRRWSGRLRWRWWRWRCGHRTEHRHEGVSSRPQREAV